MTTPKLDDQRLNDVVRDWMRDDDERTPDRSGQVSRIMDGADATRQRHRWWPVIPFGRRAVHSARDDERSPAAGTSSGGAVAALSPVRVVASLAVVAVAVTTLLYAAGQVPPATVGPGSGPMLPADAALFDQLDEVWADDEVDAASVLEVYAADAVHTSLWTDKAERFTGGEDIAARIRVSSRLSRDDTRRVRLPDTLGGVRRYLTIHPDIGGMPCVFWIADDRITRHDCILPMASYFAVPFVAGDPPTDVTRDELAALNLKAWGGDREALEQAVSPDIIHQVAFDNVETTYDGIDEYWSVTNVGRTPVPEIPNVDLPAPEGELRWVDFSDVGGGALCTFWARDDQIARHDCIVPTSR